MHYDGCEDAFPKLADLQGDEHERLYDLIMEFGGRKLIAQKLGMTYQGQTSVDVFREMSFGPFQFVFCNPIIHCDSTRNYELKPTTRWLQDHGFDRLTREVKEYSGYENVVKRLHLAFDKTEANADALGRMMIAQKSNAK